jgi:amino acid adenylation domain-containing protein
LWYIGAAPGAMPPLSHDEPRGRSNLAGPFHRRAREAPERAALWVDGRELTYGELGARAARIAAWLVGHGVSRGARVGVLAQRSELAYAGVLGTSWSGAAYVPLHPRQPESRLWELIRRARLDALISDAQGSAALGATLRDAAPALRLQADDAVSRGATTEAELARLAPLAAPVEVASDDLAYLMFTSGTTGAPKGVMVTCGNVAHFLAAAQERFRLAPDDRVSQFFDLTFDLSVFDLFATWGAGACLYVLPEAERMSPCGFVRARRLSVWFAVPSAIAILLKIKALAPGSLPSLRLSLFCGEALPAESARRWREAAPGGELHNLYGPTEATVACLAERCDGELRVTEGRDVVAIGEPWRGMHAAIAGPEGGWAPDGEAGELWLCGEQLAAGYWDDPGETAARFVERDHPRLGRRRFYRSGDLARRARDGAFHFLGRADQQVKVRGHRVELEEIEAHLRAVCGSPAAAVAWPLDHGSAEGVVAFVTATELTGEEIAGELRRRLPWYMVPRRVVHLSELPLNANGKVDRGALVRRLAP